MTTTKSYSDKSRFQAVYKASLKQQLPIGILSMIFFFLLIPLPYLVDQIYRTEPPWAMGYMESDLVSRWRSYFDGVYLDAGQAVFAVVLLMLLGLVVALVQCAYMHSRKMTDLYHSVPVRRPVLLTANTLAAMTVIFLPFLAMTLVTMAAQLIMYGEYLMGFGYYFQFILFDLLGGLVALAAVYAFTVFIATWVGTVFDNFALTGLLGFAPLVLFAICALLWQSLTYGATVQWLDKALLWLSPFTAPFLRFLYLVNPYDRYAGAVPEGGSVPAVLGIWFVVAVLFYCAAVWCYNRRKSELCEQTQPGGVLQTIAKCFAAFCGAALFYVIFSDRSNAFTMILATLFGALLIGVVAELILSRGFRFLKKNLLWLGGAGVLFCLMIFGIRADFTGYVTSVPEASEVESVSVNYRGRFGQLSDNYALYDNVRYYNGMFGGSYSPRPDTVLTDPADIALVTEMHRLAVDNPPKREHGFSGYYGDDQGYSYSQVSIEYKLKNGRTVNRGYSPLYTEAYRTLSGLETKEEFIRQNHAIFLLEAMYGEKAPELLDSMTVYNYPYGGDGKFFRPSDEDTDRILEAARQDMLAESYEELANPTAAARGYLELQFEIPDEYGGNRNYASCTVVLSAGYSHTIDVLRELDMWQDPTATEVDEIRFYHANQIGLYNNQIFSLLPGRLSDLETWDLLGYGEETPLPSVTGAADIEAVRAAARNQLMTTDGNVYAAAYYRDGVFLGGQIIRYDDLPDDIKRQVDELYNSSGNFTSEYGYPIYPERAVMSVTVSDTVQVADVDLSVA